MDIIINPYFTVPNTDKSNPGFKSYTTDYTQSIFVSYDCRKSKRLPKPFETECLSYNKSGYYDRQHCIYDCRVLDLLHNQGNWTQELTVNRSLADQMESLNRTFNFATDLVNDCEKDEEKCKHLDCMSNEYTILNKYHKLDVASITNVIEVRLYLNSAPASSLEYEAVYPLGDSFVQMFIGPASLWLGLSMYSISKLMFWFLCEITNRKAKKKTTSDDSLRNRSARLNDLTNGRLSVLRNTPDKLMNASAYLTDYRTNYRPFVFDPNLDPNIYKMHLNWRNDKVKFNSRAQLIDSSLDKHYSNQLARNLTLNGFNSPSFGKNNPISSISGGKLSPLIYKTGLEMYPKKALKIKKTINEQTPKGADQSNGNVIESNRKANSDRWLSRLANQKNKLITYLFKSHRKVYPNLINSNKISSNDHT